MATVELTLDEVIYLENTLRHIKSTGQPIGNRRGEDLAQSVLDKLGRV